MTDPIHEQCTAHSGMSTKLNANLILNGIGVFLLATLLTVAVDIRAYTIANKAEIVEIKAELSDIRARVRALEKVR